MGLCFLTTFFSIDFVLSRLSLRKVIGSSSFLQVLKESFKIYCAINDGIINLVDKVRLDFTQVSYPR